MTSVSEIYEKKRTTASSESSDEISQLNKKLSFEFLERNRKAEDENQYPKLNVDQARFLALLFPRDYSYKKGEWRRYTFDQPPVRVLRLMEKEIHNPVWTDLIICTPEKRITDPILIGLVGENTPTSQASMYLLARWGDGLDTLEQLKERAYKKVKEIDEPNYGGMISLSLFISLFAGRFLSESFTPGENPEMNYVASCGIMFMISFVIAYFVSNYRRNNRKKALIKRVQLPKGA